MEIFTETNNSLLQNSICWPTERICTSSGICNNILQYVIPCQNQHFLWYRIHFPRLWRGSALKRAFTSRTSICNPSLNQQFLYYRIRLPGLRQRSVLQRAFASRLFNMQPLTEPAMSLLQNWISWPSARICTSTGICFKLVQSAALAKTSNYFATELNLLVSGKDLYLNSHLHRYSSPF